MATAGGRVAGDEWGRCRSPRIWWMLVVTGTRQHAAPVPGDR